MEEGKENKDYGELIDEKIDELIDAIDSGNENINTIAQKLNEMFKEGKSKVETRNLEMLDNALVTELKNRKEKIEPIVKMLASKLTEPSRTHLFLMGAEREAMYMQRKRLEEAKRAVDKIISIVEKEFKLFTERKLNITDELFKNMSNYNDEEKKAIKENMNVIHSIIINKLEYLETKMPKEYSPIYKSLANFCWNCMVLYEKLEDELNVDLDKYGDVLAEKFEKYNLIYYNKKDKDREALEKSKNAYEKFIEANRDFVNKINAVLLLLDKIEEFINGKDQNDEKRVINELKDNSLLKEDISVDSDVEIGVPEIDNDLKKRFGELIVINEKDIAIIKDSMKKFKGSYNKVIELINRINQGVNSDSVKEVASIYSEIKSNIEKIIEEYSPTIKKIEKIIDNFNRVVEIHQLMYGRDVIDDGLKLKRETIPAIDSKRLKDKNIELNRAAFVEATKRVKNEISKKIKDLEAKLGGRT